MKESANARQAFNDYLAMGPSRSLEKLVEVYRGGTREAPTRRLRRLKEWSTVFGWQARLDAIAQEQEAKIRREGIASKQNRIDDLNRRQRLMWQVIEERGNDPAHQEAAGGQTGLLVRQWKQVGVGKDATLVAEFAVDTGLLKEMREHEKQAAQELGQWTEKKELTGKDGAPVAVSHQLDLSKLTNEELRALEQLVGKTAND